MFYNIIFSLLVYRAFVTHKNNKKIKSYYIILLSLSFVIASVLLFWFEVFSTGYYNFDESVGQEIINKAYILSNAQHDFQDFIGHELYGESYFESELSYRIFGRIQLVIFIVMFFPLIKQVFKLFKKIYSHIEEKKTFIIIIMASLAILPDYILKCDYGRWTYCVIIYFLFLLLSFIVMDSRIRVVIIEFLQEENQKWTSTFWPVYLGLFIPFGSVYMSTYTGVLANKSFGYIVFLLENFIW